VKRGRRRVVWNWGRGEGGGWDGDEGRKDENK